MSGIIKQNKDKAERYMVTVSEQELINDASNRSGFSKSEIARKATVEKCKKILAEIDKMDKEL